MKNIETITKFCSKLTQEFGHPYYFNWSFPTNHRDNSEEGKITDSTYFIFRVGKYVKRKSKDELTDAYGMNTVPVEKELLFGPIFTITEFTPFEMLLNPNAGVYNKKKYKVKDFKSLKKHLPELKKRITEYINKK